MAWAEIIKSLGIGVSFGAVIGLFNQWLVWSLMKKIERYPPDQGNRKLMVRYIIRYFINVTAMATYLFHRDTYILIGTAVGLIVLGKVFAIDVTFFKKGVN